MYDPVPPSDTARRDGVIALICGFVGLFILGVVLGAVAIFFGERARRAGAGGMATAGFILGIVDVALFVLLLVARGTVYA